jgi:hypothetical protein
MFSKSLVCFVQASGSKRTGSKTVESSLPDLPMSVDFTSPNEGSAIAGKITLKASSQSATADDSSISKICLKLNGKVPSSGYYRGNTPISGYSDANGCIDSSSDEPYWDFDVTTWANGQYKFSFRAISRSGEVSNTVERILTVSNSGPEFEIASPAEGSTLAGKFVIKSIATPSGEGTADIAKNCLKLNGRVPTNGYYRGNTPISGYSDVDGCISSSSTEPYWEFDTTSWANGSYQFTFYNIDSSGRISNTSNRSLTIDNANPVALTRSPIRNSSVTGKFALNGVAAPSEAGTATISRVCLLVDGKTPTSGYYRGNTPISGYSDSSGCISSSSTDPYWEFDSTSWTKKLYRFTYFVYDSSGRQSNIETWNIQVN